MGGHYGSVQVRSENREEVKVVAEQIAREKQIHILIAPPVNGWIALFPEGNGQDETVGRAVAEQLDADVLHLLVHDDDIFAYWLYRDRRQIDSYWSAPGYFGEENREKEEAMAGDPEAFRPLIGDDVARLRELLNRDTSMTFEYERLDRFGKLLKITNAVNAFEYLKEGERTGIKNWRQFVEVPAESVVSQSELRRQKRKQIAAEQKRLKSAGLLLLVDTHKEELVYGCAAGEGFLAAWLDYRTSNVSFNLYNEPWDGPGSLTLGNTDHVAGIASDASARRIAFSAGKRVSVWDLGPDGWIRVCDVPEKDSAVGIAISPDGKLLAHSSRKEIVITRIHDSERVLRWATDAAPQGLAFHPSGQWLAVSGKTLGLLAPGEAKPWRDLYVGGKCNPGAASTAMFRAKLKEMDLDALDKEFEKKKKATIDTTIAMLLKAQGRSKAPLDPAKEAETMKREMEEEFAEMKSRLVALKEGRLPPSPPQAREQIRCVGFSRDGRWFWCGTSVALRVYDWSTIPRTSAADMPASKWSFQLPGSASFEGGNEVYAIVEEPDAPAIAFGGGTGSLYRLDLITGETRELIRMGDNKFIVNLAMSADGRTLGAATYNTPAVEPRDQRQTWTIWSYSKLRGPFMAHENRT